MLALQSSVKANNSGMFTKCIYKFSDMFCPDLALCCHNSLLELFSSSSLSSSLACQHCSTILSKG